MLADVFVNVRCVVQLNEEEGEEGGMEDAAFGPRPQPVQIEDGVLYQLHAPEAERIMRQDLTKLAILCNKEMVRGALNDLEVNGHSESHTEACARYADIFSEAEKALKSGWHWIKKAGSHVYHEGVRVWNWLRQKECEHTQRVGCRGKNVAGTCEVTNTALLIGSFIPETAGLSWLMRAGGTAGYASC